MYLQSVRTSFTDKSTESHLFVNGTHLYDVLEDKDRFLEDGKNEKVYGETAIPRGIYKIILTYSPHFKMVLPEIVGVDGFTSVRMHWGNKPEDSDACLLVGQKEDNKMGDDWISNSKKSFMELLDMMIEADNRGEEITIEIV